MTDLDWQCTCGRLASACPVASALEMSGVAIYALPRADLEAAHDY